MGLLVLMLDVVPFLADVPMVRVLTVETAPTGVP